MPQWETDVDDQVVVAVARLHVSIGKLAIAMVQAVESDKHWRDVQRDYVCARMRSIGFRNTLSYGAPRRLKTEQCLIPACNYDIERRLPTDAKSLGARVVVLQLVAVAHPIKQWRHLSPKRRHPPGAHPGSVAFERDARPTSIRIVAYDKERIVEQKIDDVSEVKDFVGKWPVVWVDVVGLGSEEKIRGLAEIFKIHPLALEDIVHVHQRAKVDAYENGLFVVLRIPDESHASICEQFSLFLGKSFLVTFQEQPGDSFDLVRTGLRLNDSVARQSLHPDHLGYRLIDAGVDAYFPLLEKLGDELDELDDPDAIAHARRAFSELHKVRRKLLVLRRAVWPLRDAISSLRSETTPFVTDETRIYLRDCYDHAVQLLDLLESYRDIAGDTRDYYLSTISNRMNEIMKTLTVIATIFLPLSFIAGVYGMNFNTSVSKWNMPELNWRFGYFYSLGLMVAVTVGMLWWFRWRGWLRGYGEDRPRSEDEKRS